MPRGGSNYIPRPDGDFSAWVNHYGAAVKDWWGTQGLDNTDLKPLELALTQWQKDYPAHVAAQAAADSARAAKDAARAALEREVRPITNFVQSYPTTTDADRATIGITVRPPATRKTPAPTPTTRPLVRVDIPARLTHTLRLVDSRDVGSPTGGRSGKPKGVAGAEVWVTLVEPGATPPTDPHALSFLTMTSRSTLRTDFPTTAGGKTAVYMLRWVNTRGEKGPWSDITTATVAA